MRTTTKYGKDADRALGMWVKLARASATINKATVKDIRRYGLTQPQFAVVECLGHLGEMTIGELSRKMLVSGGNMTCVVDNLEKEGLVLRRHSDEDRRSILVDLTEKGKELFRRIFPQHAAFIVQLTSVLTAEEQEQLSRLLRKLGTAIDA